MIFSIMESWVKGSAKWAHRLSALVGVGVLGVTQPFPLATMPVQSKKVFLDVLEQRTFESVNRERTAQGLPALQIDNHLNRAARRHSQDMAERRFMSHTNPDGYGFVERARLAGVRRVREMAENLGMHRGNSDPIANVVQNLMNSPGHRKNLLNRRFKYTGIGVVRAADGTLYFTQLFADRQ